MKKKPEKLVIGIDFDGTCVTHEYPKVGRFIGAEKVIARLIEAGHKIVLWTMRDQKELQDAVNWFTERNFPLYGINENPTQKHWTTSPKAHVHLLIDDVGLGIPLVSPDPEGIFRTERPYVDWEAVEKILEERKIL